MITINLTTQQALIIRMLCACVGGMPEISNRKYSDEVTEILEEQDIGYDENYMPEGSLYYNQWK